MRLKLLNKFVITVSLLICLCSVTAFAVSSFTYSGTGIRNKRSVGRLTANSGIKVKHTTSSWNMPSASYQKLRITAERSVWYGWKIEGTKYVSGVTTKSFSFDEIPKGTYSLYFYAPNDPACANIKGSASGY